MWRHDGAASFGTLRRHRRPDAAADRWSFPVNSLAHRKQMVEQAAVISKRLGSDAFHHRRQSLSTPPRSEASFDDGAPHPQDPAQVYQPGAAAELCADVWRRVRSKRDAAAKPDETAKPDEATLLSAQPGDEATGGEEAAAEVLEVREAAAEAGVAVPIETADAAKATEGAEAAGVAKATAATTEVSAVAEAPDSAEAGPGKGDAAAPFATPNVRPDTPRALLYSPPACIFAEGTSVGSVAAARLDDALVGT